MDKNRILIGALLAIIAVLLIGAVGGAGPRLVRAAGASDESPVGSISVSGSSLIKVKPDRVAVTFGVENFGETPRATREENARLSRQVLAALRGLGIADKDLATACFNLQPEYDSYAPRRKVVGYWARNTIAVTLRDVALLEPALVAALEAGATAVDGIDFSVTNLRPLRDQAREQAVKAAMEKARDMAAAAGLAVGTVTSISENSYNYGYYGYYGLNRQWSNVQNVIQDLEAAGAIVFEDGSIALGEIIVRADVSLSASMLRGQ